MLVAGDLIWSFDCMLHLVRIAEGDRSVELVSLISAQANR